MLPRCVGGLIPLRLPPPPTSASSLPVRFTSWIQKILTNCSNAVWETLERDILSVRYVRIGPRVHWPMWKKHTHTHTQCHKTSNNHCSINEIFFPRASSVLRHCYGSTGKFPHRAPFEYVRKQKRYRADRKQNKPSRSTLGVRIPTYSTDKSSKNFVTQ